MPDSVATQTPRSSSTVNASMRWPSRPLSAPMGSASGASSVFLPPTAAAIFQRRRPCSVPAHT